MQIFIDTNFDFMGKRRLCYFLSGSAIVLSIVSLLIHGGPRYSVDFTGGSFVEVQFPQPIEAGQLRAAMNDVGLASAEIQRVGAGSDYILRMKEDEVAKISKELVGGEISDPFGVIRKAVERKMPGTEVILRRQETVGPKIGSELRTKAVQAVLVSLLLILIYVAFRFPGVSYAVAAVLALFHDVFITIGFFSVLGKEVSLTVLAALLTIAGYSINDTIVVYDRIREELRAHRRESLAWVMNKSVNLTLSRTVLTSFTVFVAALGLFLFGGTVIHDFAFAMLIGVVVGTYSSIFVASALVLSWTTWRSTRETGRKGARRQSPAAAKTA